MEYVFGVRTGSIANCERNRIGVLWLIVVGINAWRTVGARRLDGQRREGRFRMFWVRERFGDEMGVTISLTGEVY